MHGLLDSTPQIHESWQQRTKKATRLLRNDCLGLEHVQAVDCSILGGPQILSLFLECHVEDHPQKTEIIEYVEFVLLEALEHYLGVQIEQRTITFTTPAGDSQHLDARPTPLITT